MSWNRAVRPPAPPRTWSRRLALAAVALSLTGTALVVTSPTASAEPECLAPSFDVDRDNTPDAVIGAPGGTGSVQVRVTHEDDPQVVTIPAPAGATGFGTSIASVSSYENEGDDALCSQLAIGAPGETVAQKASAGAVYLYVWNGTGFDLRARYAPGSNGVPGTPQAGARFGAALAAGLHWDDSFAEPSRLYVGLPGQTVGGVTGAGAVTSFTVGAQSVTASTTRTVTYASAGVPGNPSTSGGFGTALSATGSVVAVGAPGQTAAGVTGAGEVVMISDQRSPFSPFVINQASSGVPGSPERGDRFGAAVHLTVGTATDYRLLIGAPGEDVSTATGSAVDAGTVAATRSPWTDPSRFTATGWDQNSSGVAGAAESGDGFGSAVSSTTDATGALTYLVGTPGEDIGTAEDAGMVQVVGRSTNPSWTQSSAGIPGTPETGDRMGATLSDSIARVGPLVGMPGEDASAGAVLSGLPLTTSAVRFWKAVSPVAGARYGTSVAP